MCRLLSPRPLTWSGLNWARLAQSYVGCQFCNSHVNKFTIFAEEESVSLEYCAGVYPCLLALIRRRKACGEGGIQCQRRPPSVRHLPQNAAPYQQGYHAAGAGAGSLAVLYCPSDCLISLFSATCTCTFPRLRPPVSQWSFGTCPPVHSRNSSLVRYHDN